jgi:hypothetical protein
VFIFIMSRCRYWDFKPWIITDKAGWYFESSKLSNIVYKTRHKDCELLKILRDPLQYSEYIDSTAAYSYKVGMLVLGLVSESRFQDPCMTKFLKPQRYFSVR